MAGRGGRFALPGGRSGPGGLALVAALLAVLTLILSVPQHVLDFDEDGGSVAVAATHGPTHTILDHQAPGHACAGHCAAHVMGDAPAAITLRPAVPIRLAWLWIDPPSGVSLAAAPLDRPPRG